MSGANTDKLRANTKEEDSNALINDGFRYRNMETDRFLTEDPAGFIDGLNLFAYVNQNPWTSFDPQGLSGKPSPNAPRYQGAAAEQKAWEDYRRAQQNQGSVFGALWSGSAKSLTGLAGVLYNLSTPGLLIKGAGYFNDSARAFDQGMNEAHQTMDARITNGVTHVTGPVNPEVEMTTQFATPFLAGGLGSAPAAVVKAEQATTTVAAINAEAQAAARAVTPVTTAAADAVESSRVAAWVDFGTGGARSQPMQQNMAGGGRLTLSDIGLANRIKASGMTTRQAGEFFGWKAGEITKPPSSFTMESLSEAGWTQERLTNVAEGYRDVLKVTPKNPSAAGRADQLEQLAKLYEDKK